MATDSGSISEEGMTPQKCVHRWVMDSSRVVRLTRDRASQHPNCVGRPSTCRLCGESRVHPERVWDIAWTQ
mgnify:CR=1 FL=1